MRSERDRTKRMFEESTQKKSFIRMREGKEQREVKMRA
jgi:hypothetical protein